MLGRFTDGRGNLDCMRLVRCYGHGVPDERKLMSSLSNSLKLIAEQEIQPFFKDGGAVKTREMREHPLPGRGKR